jgi:hypothetical protein
MIASCLYMHATYSPFRNTSSKSPQKLLLLLPDVSLERGRPAIVLACVSDECRDVCLELAAEDDEDKLWLVVTLDDLPQNPRRTTNEIDCVLSSSSASCSSLSIVSLSLSPTSWPCSPPPCLLDLLLLDWMVVVAGNTLQYLDLRTRGCMIPYRLSCVPPVPYYDCTTEDILD